MDISKYQKNKVDVGAIWQRFQNQLKTEGGAQ
jgi:hypothetical protein